MFTAWLLKPGEDRQWIKALNKRRFPWKHVRNKNIRKSPDLEVSSYLSMENEHIVEWNDLYLYGLTLKTRRGSSYFLLMRFLILMLWKWWFVCVYSNNFVYVTSRKIRTVRAINSYLFMICASWYTGIPKL